MNTPAPDPDTAVRMQSVAAALTAAGLTAQVHLTRGVLDVTATWERADGKAAEVIVDDDGYVEVRYWNRPGAPRALYPPIPTAPSLPSPGSRPRSIRPGRSR